MLRPLLIFALVVAAGLGFREFWTSPPEAFFKQSTTTADVPKANTYMLDTETRQFDQQGNLAYRLTTDRSEHFTRAQRFILENPKITSFPKDAQPWTLSSRKGVVEKNGETILLTGGVNGRRFQANKGTAKMHTESLLFFPDRQYAETDKKVTIELPGHQSTGVGLEANFAKRQYKLLSKVKETHDAE